MSRILLVLACVTLAFSTSLSAATLSGRILDPDGRGVAGAHIVITSPLGLAADRTADRDGRFDVPSLPAGTYQIRAVADGLRADAIDVALGEDETRTIDIALHLSALAESIIVSATPIDLPLSRAGDSVTVISAADLQARQIDTVADALRLVPDMAVTRNGGRGGVTSLFPRGGASNYALVLVDGMRANAFGGGYDFGHLSVADIERIEVVRGPASALFGSDAVAAVVQIVTKRGGPARGHASIEGGSQGTERLTADGAGSHGRWSWGGGFDQSRSDGFTGTAPATGERVTNDDDHMRRVSGSLEWQRPAGPDVLVSGNLARDERGVPGAFGSNPIGAFTAVDRVSRGVNDTRQLGVRVTHPWSSRVRQRVEANIFDLSSDFTSQYGPSTSGTRRIDGRLQEDVAFTPTLGASAGLEWLRERGSSSYVTGASGDALPIERTALGPFAEVHYVGHERFFATAGVRLEHLTRDALDADGFGSRPAFATQTTDSVNPKIAVRVTAAKSADGRMATELHASAGTGIRPPDVFEIAFTDNPNLKPERIRSIDAGIEQRLAGDRLIVGATAFFNRYDDLLVTVGRTLADASHYKTDNISNARARGLELTADVRPLRQLIFRANYTFLDTAILSVDRLTEITPFDPASVTIVPLNRPFKVGDALLRRPRHQGSIDATYAFGRVTAFGDVTTRSRVLDVEPSFGASGGVFFTPGYLVANVGASVQLSRNLTVFGRVLNVTDRNYEETLGYPALPRRGFVGIRVGVGR